jgi:hypothetical protein
MISHGPQFRPIGAPRWTQPISDPFYERLERSWLAFQCLMRVAFIMFFENSINDNFNSRWFSWNQLLSLTEPPPPPAPVALQSLKDLGRLTYRRFLELFRQMVGLRGRMISPSQGLYLHRTTQHRKTRTNIHALSGIRTHDPSNQPTKTHASDRTATVID